MCASGLSAVTAPMAITAGAAGVTINQQGRLMRKLLVYRWLIVTEEDIKSLPCFQVCVCSITPSSRGVTSS
ncbi:hypothetical protein HanXRQr2_Chr09g0367221 [Helianthus annuus]|uniref:Uncharacterized protein n=1 Tax=Helianthus annuus TaxID=4232 RepID=A0A9K3N6I2_HELAN|nr:hypothetical protein HanXRQr2_Chr09g0367221 [Helianthus annuus]